jgi:hypothetical protein
MQNQPTTTPRTLLNPILGFTATPKIVTTLPLIAPPHDFLLMTLCPQLTPELAPLASQAHPHRTRTA